MSGPLELLCLEIIGIGPEVMAATRRRDLQGAVGTRNFTKALTGLFEVGAG
ncbi:MAG: hypothetical protein AB3N19_13395 [Ruegeria sp.]